ncbi:MAG: hypothetical protein OEN20_06970 [Gammaproteobacteria bacterium]|nr:hypothetical protein [Gammaproteobacteria bacterium]
MPDAYESYLQAMFGAWRTADPLFNGSSFDAAGRVSLCESLTAIRAKDWRFSILRPLAEAIAAQNALLRHWR